MLQTIIGFGANLFVLIVTILLAFAIGLSTTDFLKTKDRDEKHQEIE